MKMKMFGQAVLVVLMLFFASGATDLFKVLYSKTTGYVSYICCSLTTNEELVNDEQAVEVGSADEDQKKGVAEELIVEKHNKTNGTNQSTERITSGENTIKQCLTPGRDTTIGEFIVLGSAICFCLFLIISHPVMAIKEERLRQKSIIENGPKLLETIQTLFKRAEKEYTDGLAYTKANETLEKAKGLYRVLETKIPSSGTTQPDWFGLVRDMREIESLLSTFIFWNRLHRRERGDTTAW